MTFRFIRQLGAVPSLYPHYESDLPLAENIAEWGQKIKLAGQTISLSVETEAVCQIPTQVINVQGYVITVSKKDDLATLQKLVASAACYVSPEARSSLKKNVIAGAILNLNRTIHYAAGARKDTKFQAKPQRGRFLLGDAYWLDLYNDKLEFIARVYHDSIGMCYRPTLSEAAIIDYASRLREYYPEPDELIVTWHQLAEMFNLHRSRIYIQACLASAGWQRTVWGWPAPVTDSSVPWILWGKDENMPVYDPASLEVGFVYPDWETTEVWHQLKIWHVGIALPNSAVELLPPTTTPQADQLPEQSNFTWQVTELHSPPQPQVPSGNRGAVLVDFLRRACAGNAIYLGGGLFKVRIAAMTQLAAGTGQWGSKELVVLVVNSPAGVSALSATAAGFGIAGTAIRGGAAIYSYARKDEIAEELSGCYETSSSVEECLDCVKASQAYSVSTVNSIGAGAGAAGGILAAFAASNPVGWVVAGVAILGCAALLVLDHMARQDMLDACYDNYQ